MSAQLYRKRSITGWRRMPAPATSLKRPCHGNSVLDARGQVASDLVDLDQRVDRRAAVRAVRPAGRPVLRDPRGALLADAAVGAGQQHHAAGQIHADRALRQIRAGVLGPVVAGKAVALHLPAYERRPVRLRRRWRGQACQHCVRATALDLFLPELLPVVLAALFELEPSQGPGGGHQLLVLPARDVHGDPVGGVAAEADEDAPVGGDVLHLVASAALDGPHPLRRAPHDGQAVVPAHDLVRAAEDADEDKRQHDRDDQHARRNPDVPHGLIRRGRLGRVRLGVPALVVRDLCLIAAANLHYLCEKADDSNHVAQPLGHCVCTIL
mmetsp:Transcript_62974/g.177623  ORF Transcript_62974/g.177623 Transcript_62974/m.177623 type:complete len:325 (+) Transcript_62974:88-1062(+)